MKKLIYISPAMQVLSVATTHLMAVSGTPEVHTTDAKVDAGRPALSKGNTRGNVWDEEW